MATPDFHTIKLGMTRDEVVAILGEPESKSVSTRKYRTPAVFKYGNFQFTFGPNKSGGLLWVNEYTASFQFVRKVLPPPQN